MRLGSVASGSSGNCIYVGDEQTHLLVDAGISGKRIVAGLLEHDMSIHKIQGILITHEHIDHIAGLGVLSRKYGIPIYVTRLTKMAIMNTKSVGVIQDELFVEIAPEESFQVGTIQVFPIPISHDAVDPVAYRLESNGKKVAILTDVGCYDNQIVCELQGLDAILIEANHDENMVQVGTYPYGLKQRILGKKGHLSNANAGRLLNEIIHDNMKQIVLGHLSGENNIPELAYETVRMELTMADNGYTGTDYPILVANRSSVTDLIKI